MSTPVVAFLVRLSIRLSLSVAWKWFACQNDCHTGCAACRSTYHTMIAELLQRAYLFAKWRANRIKVLMHDGMDIWLAARRLHQGKFVWSLGNAASQLNLSCNQLDALILGLPWQRMSEASIILEGFRSRNGIVDFLLLSAKFTLDNLTGQGCKMWMLAHRVKMTGIATPRAHVIGHVRHPPLP